MVARFLAMLIPVLLPICLFGLISFGPQDPLGDPFAVPKDARDLLVWHLQADSETEEWDLLMSSLFRYFSSSAVGEARKVAARMQELSPGDPESQRFLLHIEAALPGTTSDAIKLCDSWLAMHPHQPADQIREVEGIRKDLQKDWELLGRLEESKIKGRLAPMVALVILGFFFFHIRKSTLLG